MSDLTYTVEVTGLKDVEQLEKNLDRLHNTLNAGQGSGKSLEEMRKILVGMRGQSSVIADLRDSVKGLNSAAEQLGVSFNSGFKQLDRTFKQGFQLVLDRVNMFGAESGKSLSSGAAKMFNDAGAAAQQGGKNLAEAVRNGLNETTKAQEAAFAKDVKLNAKYATELNTARQEILDKGTSKMLESLRKRGEVIRRLVETEGEIGLEVAKKSYGTDFVNTVRKGLVAQQKLLSDHVKTVRELADAQVEAYAGRMNQKAVDRAREVAKAQLAANSRAIKEELAAVADAFAKSPDTLANMQKFYTLETSVAQASVDRARKVAKEQFAANSRAIKEELAAAADAFAKSPDTLANMRKFYTLQASAAGYVEERARKEAREAFAARSKAFKEEAAKFSQESYGGAMQQLASQYTNPKEMAYMGQLRDATVGLSAEQKKAAKDADLLRSSLRGLAVDGNDTHSAMRGLASGFNLLWLTWGNLAPLFAGAAISNGFMQTAKQGMEVAHTLEVVATLGENSAESMKDLTSELIRLGQNGPRGPLEIAEALKTLSLAGLDANKILAVTGTVLNFSTSGTTSLQTAADVLVSVTTAFGTGAAGFERSADIITRAAADSKASVESFGEAMKTASVAGEQYGAKQEDVALLIQLLAQVGIQGSAAGTSVRNMYADITGRSGQVGKILESLKLDFKDLDGNVVSTVEQMRMLDEVLKQYDSKSQGNIIQAIYGERGSKAAIAALQAYRTAAVDSSKYVNKLEEDFAKVANAAADSAITAARLGQTSQKAFETAGAAMRTTMFEAFREIEPQLYMTAVAFQEAFGSAETRELLQSMTSAVATLGMAVAKNLEPIAKVAILWAEYRLALFAVNNILSASVTLKQSYATVTKALTAATVADTTATALNNAAKASPALAGAAAGRTLYTANITASTGAVTADTTATAANTRAKQANQIATAGIGMTVLKALPVVGNVIALASVAWMIFKSATDDAGNAVENYAQTKADKIAEKLEQEAEHLRRVNEERLKGIGLMEAEARVREGYDREASVSDLTTKEDKLRSKLNNLNALKENIEKSTRKGDQGVLDAVVNNIQATDAALTAAMVSRAAAEDRFDRAAAERRKRTKESNDIAVKEAADQAKQLKDALEKGVGGLKTWSLTDFQGGGGGASRTPPAFRTWYDENFETFKLVTDAQGAYMKTMYDQGKVSVDEYYDYLLSKASKTAELEREHLLEQIKVFSADPKSTRAAKEASAKLTALEFKTEAEKLELAAQYNKALQENLSIRQQIEMFSKNYNEKLRGDGTDIMGIQRGGAAVEAYRAELQVRQDFLKERERIEKDFAQKSIGLSEEGLVTQRALMQTALDDLRTKEAAALQIVRDHETLKAQERMNPLNGVRSALEDYTYQAQDLAGLTKTATSRMLTSLEDAFVQLATTGKVSFKDMANSIMADLARIAARQAVMGLASQVFGSLPGFNIPAGLQASGAITYPVYGASAMPTISLAPRTYAKGNVFMDSPSLSSFSNQVHDRPQLFAFAKGAGVFGEAGPEAIMPLTRGADGNLGVRAHGGETNVNIEIVNNGSPVQATTTQSTAQDGTKLIKVVLEAVAGDVRGRGKIYQAIKQTV